MADPELEELRKQRLAQMQSQMKNPENAEKQEQAKKAQEDMKHSILAQILDQSARARLNTLLLGKPEKGQMVENMLLKMAQVGQIRNKLGEKDLIGILESVNAQIPQASTAVKFDRRRAALDSDDEDF